MTSAAVKFQNEADQDPEEGKIEIFNQNWI